MNARCYVLSFILICGLAAPGQAQAGGGKGGCQDIPLQLTISPVQVDGSGYPGIYGDGGPTSPATYTDGSRGVYAKFQVCNGTNDFILNLGRPSNRFFTVDFSKPLGGADLGVVQPTGTVGAWFINLDHAAIKTVSVDTLMNITTSGAGNVVYCGPPPSFAAFNLLCSVVEKDNTYNATSLVRVTVNCSAVPAATWTIAPVPLSGGALFGYPVAGLSEANGISGGYYSMPFSMTLTRTDGKAGCTGLPQ